MTNFLHTFARSFAAVCALTTAHPGETVAQNLPSTSADLPPQVVALNAMSAFRAPTAGWKIVGDASTLGEGTAAFATSPGVGVMVHLSSGRAHSALSTAWDHGDIDLSFDVMTSRGSRASVLLMGLYGVELSDSWMNVAPSLSTIGAIAPTGFDAGGRRLETFEGTLPRQNAGRAPGLWQHVDIVFRAPRFAGGQKVSNARFSKVSVNGVLVQENVLATASTLGVSVGEQAAAPLVFEGGGAFAIRNIRYKTYTNSVALSGLRYRVYEGEGMSASWASSHTPTREGTASSISPDLQVPQDRFAVAYEGTLTAPTAGRYRFGLALGWIGNDSTSRGPSIGGGTLSVDGGAVVTHTGAERRAVGDVDLTPGPHAVTVSYYKNRPQFNRRDVSITAEGPGVERRSLSDDNAGVAGGGSAPTDPIMVEPQAEPIVLRSFVRHRNTKRVYVASVADPLGVHYSYDLAQGSLLYAWRGPFLETTQMWHERGEDQTAEPMGSTLTLPGVPSVTHLVDVNAAWPDSLDEKQFRRDGYRLDEGGHPTFLYYVGGNKIEDAFRPTADGLSLRRELRIHEATLSPTRVWPRGPYVQIAQGDHIARQRDGTYVVGDRGYYVMLPAGSATPILRHVNGMDELIVPVRFKNGEAAVAYTIAW